MLQPLSLGLLGPMFVKNEFLAVSTYLVRNLFSGMETLIGSSLTVHAELGSITLTWVYRLKSSASRVRILGTR